MSVSPDRPVIDQLIEEMPEAAGPPSRAVWRSLRSNPMAIASISVLTVILLASIFIPMISPYSYSVQTNDISAKPSLKHWLGTDDSGYDLAVRLAVGGRISLFVGIGVETICLFVGIAVGLLAGYYGRWSDTLLMRFTDMMFAFPDILLAILIMSVVSPSYTGLAAGLGAVFATLCVTGWPSMARLVRGQTLVIKQREFVEAARAIGVPNREIMLKHVLPNLLSPIVVAATIDIAGIIVAESTLSFLGLGIPPPLPSWGSLISGPLASGYWQGYPGLVLYPAAALTLTVLSFNFLGDALRDALDPRSNT
jgi:ABC-type dipeptide/oligopeptide/nickel transport system permease subunit